MTTEQTIKRKRVMQRSMALGHCVCNPRKGCPCDVFRDRGICECAGERLPAVNGGVRLTEHVRSTGCGSKVGKKDLNELLAGLPEIHDRRVVIGSNAGDDAGVIMLSDDVASVLTVDVFTPPVDDPYTFGQIAAANSLSDIYAMGATPQTALSIIGIPLHRMPLQVMRDILRGGIDKMKEAGISVIGGHSINDEEIKCGFAVVGTAGKNELVANTGAQAGDVIVLTKPLGGGIITFANQIGRAADGMMEDVAASMTSLNKLAGKLMVKHHAHAATDVTGFGLLVHMAEIVRNSGVEVELDFDQIPLFRGVSDLARQEVLPGGVERNREAIDETMLQLGELAPAQESILFCPETSGGLLVFLPAKEADLLVRELRKGGVREASVIGKVVNMRAGGRIRVRTVRAEESLPLLTKPSAQASSVPEVHDSCEATSCCSGASSVAGDSAADQVVTTAPKASEAFAAYMSAVNAPGALGMKEKKLINLALSVLSRCDPCVRINRRAAIEAGATEEETAEAAALGIAFGGAPTGMFYSGVRLTP